MVQLRIIADQTPDIPAVVASALALGTLVHVMPPELPLPEAHFLAWSAAALEKPLGAAFHSWIINEARRFDRRD